MEKMIYILVLGQPLEPIHVHVVEGVPAPNTTKVWITRTG